MLEISDSAHEEITRLVTKDKEDKAVRVYLSDTG